MKKREHKDIWRGLFDFALIEKNKPLKLEGLLEDEQHRHWFQQIDDFRVSKKYKHILTHQTIHCRFIHVKAKAAFSVPDEALSFYSQREIAELPKPVLISRYLMEQNAH